MYNNNNTHLLCYFIPQILLLVLYVFQLPITSIVRTGPKSKKLKTTEEIVIHVIACINHNALTSIK